MVDFFPANIYAKLIGFILFMGLFYIISRLYQSKKPNKILSLIAGIVLMLIAAVSLIFSIFFFQYTEVNLILRIFLGTMFILGSLTCFLLSLASFSTIKNKPNKKTKN